jgi:membrane dipeptidase
MCCARPLRGTSLPEGHGVKGTGISQQPVIDCHSDVAVDIYRRRQAGESAVLSRVHAPAYREGGVVASVCMVGGDTPIALVDGEDQPYRSTLSMLAALQADVDESDGAFAIVTSPEEVKARIAEGVFAIVLAIEGAAPVEGDLSRLEALHDRGIRVVGLTWNSRNEIAVGLGSGEGGLTEFGVRAVGMMNDLGMLIDLSHASPTTFWDVAETSKAPLYVSHSNAKAIRDHARNLDDDQLRAVADSGGAVGLVTYADFVASPPVGLNELHRHLDYFRETIGDDCIVIGADFVDYVAEETASFARENSSYNDLPSLFTTGLESVSSMQNLIELMRTHGVPDDTITGIASENFLRLLAHTDARASR